MTKKRRIIRKGKKPEAERVPDDQGAVLPPLRAHQEDALEKFRAGRRNQYHVWHRRAGKDWFGMGIGAETAAKEVGTYWHLLPKQVQARRALWTGIDHQSGRRFIDLFFPDAASVNNTEMLIETASGSTWQLLGSDNYDRMVGSNPRGVVFSEWALCDPRSWEYISPILRANGGWAIFITTFRGRNHAWQMYERLRRNPDWYVTLRTIRDTGLLTEADIDQDRAAGMSEKLVRQEYFCDPAPSPLGGPFARVYDGLVDAGRLLESVASFNTNAAHYVACHEVGDYIATLESFVRGDSIHYGRGAIMQRAAAHEVLAPFLHGRERTKFVVDSPLSAELDALGLRPAVNQPATIVETAGQLERATIDPTSPLATVLSGAPLASLEEDADQERAAEALYGALRLLATIGGTGRWSAPLDYRRHDSCVIVPPSATPRR